MHGTRVSLLCMRIASFRYYKHRWQLISITEFGTFMLRLLIALFACFSVLDLDHVFGQDSASLEQQLKEMTSKKLLKRSQLRGDAKRGALVFYKSAAACSKCHEEGISRSPLGPTLTSISKDTTELSIIESVLYPSKVIRKGYESVKILTRDGDVFTGLVTTEDDDELRLRSATNLQKEVVVNKSDIELKTTSDVSMMPEGLVASIGTERDFYDLVRYLVAVARGGEIAAAKLRPSAKQLLIEDDTKNLDHAGILRHLNEKDRAKGQRIYNNHCINCHGRNGNQPSLATARAFGTDTMKYGADPLSMLLTLTKGNGLMAAMQHLTPRERYQVIHFIREDFMKGRNQAYKAIDDAYLEGLPTGTSSGETEIVGDRDFGPVLGSQLGREVNNALTFRLPDQVTVNYDLHRFRLGGVWKGGFLDLSQTQHYRQRGEQMPKPAGTSIPGLETYGWAFGNEFKLDADAKPPRGPLRSDLAQYRGHYLHGDRAILSYAIGGREVLESIDLATSDPSPILVHTLQIDSGDHPLTLCVGKSSRPGTAGLINDGELIVSSRSGAASSNIAVAPNAAKTSTDAATHTNQAQHIQRGQKARSLDLGNVDRTIVVRFRTERGGTLIASAPEHGEWKPDGKTMFIRGKRMVFDIGWVGAMVGKTDVTDNQWHTAVLHVGKEYTALFVDGKLEAKKRAFRRAPVDNHVLKIGATATDFGGDLDGELSWISILDGEASNDQLKAWSRASIQPQANLLWSWKPSSRGQSSTRTISSTDRGEGYTMATAWGDTESMRWSVSNDDHIYLTIPASERSRTVRVARTSLPLDGLKWFRKQVSKTRNQGIENLGRMTHGGPRRWPQELTVSGSLGESVNGYALDTIPVPFDNPWNAWLRTSALDFLSDGRCVVTTHGGDVYIVNGIDDDLEHMTWTRYVAGLFEPFGARVVDDQIYVTCRDGIKRLHDFDGNGEADFVEAFWIDDDVSSKFHAYNFDLQTDSKGNFYFAKAGQYTNHARPGTIMRVPPDGGRADVVAWGIRTPNGMGKLADDRFTVSDNQGPWMPAGKISLIKQDAFLGNMPINDEQDQWLRSRHDGDLPKSFDEPFIWMPQELDNSCGGQIWVDDKRWGPLSGRLIHSSYGKGWLYYLDLNKANGKTQSSIVALPHQWEAGVMRLRVNPIDGQLYGVGLSGWQGPKGGKDGCFQRLRYTGGKVHHIEKTRISEKTLELTFSFALSDQAKNPEFWTAEMWDYLWSKKYGSDQFSVLNPGTIGRDALHIKTIELTDNNHTAKLTIPKLSVCDQLRLEMEFEDLAGETFVEEIFFTIHQILEQ